MATKDSCLLLQKRVSKNLSQGEVSDQKADSPVIRMIRKVQRRRSVSKKVDKGHEGHNRSQEGEDNATLIRSHGRGK